MENMYYEAFIRKAQKTGKDEHGATAMLWDGLTDANVYYEHATSPTDRPARLDVFERKFSNIKKHIKGAFEALLTRVENSASQQVIDELRELSEGANNSENPQALMAKILRATTIIDENTL